MQIPLCYDKSQVSQCRGRYMDVWMGDYLGQWVATKVLRVCSMSEFDKIRRVGWLCITLSMPLVSWPWPMQRFCKEVIRWKALTHPNMLPLLGVTMDRYHFVMVLEWMEDRNINKFIKSHEDISWFELVRFYSHRWPCPSLKIVFNSSKTSPGVWYTSTISQ